MWDKHRWDPPTLPHPCCLGRGWGEVAKAVPKGPTFLGGPGGTGSK